MKGMKLPKMPQQAVQRRRIRGAGRQEAEEGRAVGADQDAVAAAASVRVEPPSGERGKMLSIRMTADGLEEEAATSAWCVTEARSARESSFVENLGTYNPRSKPAQVEINKERIEHWLKQGARPSTRCGRCWPSTCRAICRRRRPRRRRRSNGWRRWQRRRARCARWSKWWCGRWSISPTRCG